MKPILISSGEPAGIGPDICLQLADTTLPVVVVGDLNLLKTRAKQLMLKIKWIDYNSVSEMTFAKGTLIVYHIPCPHQVICGQLNVQNTSYVLNILDTCIDLCIKKTFRNTPKMQSYKSN